MATDLAHGNNRLYAVAAREQQVLGKLLPAGSISVEPWFIRPERLVATTSQGESGSTVGARHTPTDLARVDLGVRYAAEV